MSGAIISQKTTSKLDFVVNGASAGSKIVLDCMSYGVKGDVAEDWEGVVAGTLNYIQALYGVAKEKDGLAIALKLAQAHIDLVLLVMGKSFPKELGQPISSTEGCSNPWKVQDCLQAAALACKLGLWVTALVTKAVKATFVGGVGWTDTTDVKLQYGKFSVMCGEEDMLARAFNEYSVPFLAEINQNQQDMNHRIDVLEHPAGGLLI